MPFNGLPLMCPSCGTAMRLDHTCNFEYLYKCRCGHTIHIPFSEDKWIGVKPLGCLICHKSFKKFFVSGQTRGHDIPVLMCVTCHRIYGQGWGKETGELYSLETLKRLNPDVLGKFTPLQMEEM